MHSLSLQIAIEQAMFLQNYVCDKVEKHFAASTKLHILVVSITHWGERKNRICYLQGNEKVKT